ncbi:MAG: DUF3108 domain-containing protein [Rubrivivax sp.]|nr:DUF3108 domain-containing protein [Rubrivivax sp.]
MLAYRRRHLAALTAGVTLAHVWLAGQVLTTRLGEGAHESRPRRIDVAFVRELAPAAPPPAPAAPPRVRPRRAAAAPAAQASAPEPVFEAAQPPVAALEATAQPMPELVPELDPAPPALTAVPAPAAPAASAAAAFEWPPSTRLSYTLTGHWRGPLVGDAQVEWLRSGTRYQVHMKVSAGLVVSRHSRSEGEITPEGLSPRQYDEVTEVPFSATRRLSVQMDPDRVRFADGRELPRAPGLQDSVSQFVHLTWLSITQPQWLTPGRTIEMPVALPRRVELITYEVVGGEELATPAGPVQTVHIKPRARARTGGDLSVEFWVAPSLQYLPVRVLIRQDTESYVDLLIERLPEQAAEGK